MMAVLAGIVRPYDPSYGLWGWILWTSIIACDDGGLSRYPETIRLSRMVIDRSDRECINTGLLMRHGRLPLCHFGSSLLWDSLKFVKRHTGLAQCDAS